jgi:GH3 auxin-responsive promoter
MVSAAIANLAWLAASARAHAQFKAALDDPAHAQDELLRRYLRTSAGTGFGREHGLSDVHTYEQFAQRVPIRDYDELSPWIERIRRGESNVLTRDPVRRLVPTSGSTAARKLIPYTDESHRELNRAVGPWICGLYRQAPRAILGPAYWSVTPLIQKDPDDGANDRTSAIPIGFDDDCEYLGAWSKRLLAAAMVVPGSLKRIPCVDTSRYVTLLLMLRRRDLSLISVWHPSFLELLLRDLVSRFDELVNDVAAGTCAVADRCPQSLHPLLVAQPNPARARQIARIGPSNLTRLWPRLAVVSCWADGHSAHSAAALSRKLPDVLVQPKGLLATEGVVSIPFAGQHPLAIRSHFLEFLDNDGLGHLVADLKLGQTYSVVLTTGGGLWRYRLNDLVQVTGLVARTPSVRFIGKVGLVSDRVGEKLSEGFVASVLSRLFADHPSPPTFALLAPDRHDDILRYNLYANCDVPAGARAALDDRLKANPQYAYARALGQLSDPRCIVVGADAYERYAQRLLALGQRMGDIKPAALSTLEDWTAHFARAQPAPHDRAGLSPRAASRSEQLSG